ncbi:MAG TPA: hypothetical protein VM345_07965 [Acidimicrobiales bacterium]|nr:hypothetical protein [Acidimicrobiales bacterium]
MPKTVRVRDIDDEVYAALAKQAAEAGITVADLLLRAAVRVANRPSVDGWLARTRGRPSTITAAEVQDAFDAVRGDWPLAGG